VKAGSTEAGADHDSGTGLKRSVDIHRTAIVDSRASIGSDVRIGPHTIIGPHVSIGDGTVIGPNCIVEGWTEIGPQCLIVFSASIGLEPQDLKYRGERSWVRIGRSSTIREFVSIHRATGEELETTVGDSVFLMAYAHVAHNCAIGNNVVVSNAVNMGGHVTIEDYASVSGLTAIHQFVRIGRHSYTGGGSRVPMDVVPYIMVAGNPPVVSGLNTVGLQRHGFPAETIRVLKQAYRLLFRSDLNTSRALEQIKSDLPMIPEIANMIEFIETSERGIRL
jgi:UDP-N-acetylglucosamine acyltransferase